MSEPVFKVKVVLSIIAPTREEAVKNVEKWFEELSASVDSFPEGFDDLDIYHYEED